MIYITGDTHGNEDIRKLRDESFPAGKTLKKDDYLIITGDFGGVWFGDIRDNKLLEFYENQKYTILFVDGNHENFDALSTYPVEKWNGGFVQFIRKNIIHLMRGQIYEIEGKTFFTFGGGLSIDKYLRTPYVSWWPQEEPNNREIDTALDALADYNCAVDYIITHAAPESIMRNTLSQIHPMKKIACSAEKFLDQVYNMTDFKMWFCGHYHMDVLLRKEKLCVLYNDVIRLDNGYPIINTNFRK